MVAQTAGNPIDLVVGALLQVVEAVTLGMPFEVWKTRMGRFRDESTFQAFRNVYKHGGGVGAFWSGTSAKIVESALKGAVLLYSKELIADSLESAGTVTSGMSTGAVIANTFKTKGIAGFYPGASAVAFRQASNWASRQGFTDAVRSTVKHYLHGSQEAQLTKPQEVLCGVIGGTLSTWNQPFEVSRIQMQAAAMAGEPQRGLIGTMNLVVKEQGVAGLFKGIVPRIGLGIWQTLFMVVGARTIKEYTRERFK